MTTEMIIILKTRINLQNVLGKYLKIQKFAKGQKKKASNG